MRVADNVRRVTTLRARKFAARGFPSYLTVTSRMDTDRPTVAGVTVDRDVDVCSQPANLTVAVRGFDDRSGVARMQVSLWPPIDASNIGPLPSGLARRSDGTRRHGTWTTTLPVDDCSSWPGEWNLLIFMWDRVGHRTISDPGTA